MTPSYVTSDYVAFLALYRLYKVNKVTCDFPDVAKGVKFLPVVFGPVMYIYPNLSFSVA